MYLKGYDNVVQVDANDQPILDAAGNKIRLEEAPNLKVKLQDAGMWSEACAQIFFTLSICIGVMVSYSSYNPVDAPIIANGFAVSLCNSGFSFFAGFAVFSTVGYLIGMNSPVQDKVSSIALAFVAYPAAVETMPGANFWTLLLSVTLFTLGIDSAFAMVEGTVTVVQETKIGKKMSKVVIATMLCVIGAIFSTFFCFNWGFTFFDIIDHYLNVYLVLLMGILQSVSIGWYFCQDQSMEKSRPASLVLMIMYFGLMIPLAWLCYFAFPEQSWVGLPVIWIWNILAIILSALIAKFVSKCTFAEWYNEIFFSGVKPIAAHMIARNQTKQWTCTEKLFEFWWCFSIKYVFPWAMYWLIVMTVQKDTTYPYYGKYYGGWQFIGILFPLAGIILFLIPLIFNRAAGGKEFKDAFDIKKAVRRDHSPNAVEPMRETPAKEVEMEQE